MSQKIPSDSSQKGFAVGRGLLAAAETLNFSMNEQRSDSLHHGSTARQLHGMSSGMGGGECDPQLSRRGGGSSHIGNSIKLFSSLGLSPADLDVLAQIPEDNISVETLPHLIMQLKNRKVDSDRRMAGNSRGDLSGLSSEPSYRASRDDWDDMRVGKLGGSMGQASAHAQQGDLGYNSIQDTSAGRYELDYGHGSGGRDPGWYSDLSRDGLRHTENQRLLLQMYPEWDPHMATSRSGGSHLLETTNQSAGLLGPIPMAERQQAGGGRMSSGWGGGAGSNVGSGKPHQHSMALKQIRSKVVVAKYDRSPLSNKALFALVEPFGTLCEHLVLKNKAFLEMETHKEARDVVSYYQQNPALLHGKQITCYLSKELMVIQEEGSMEQDFPENMDDFVTLDELAEDEDLERQDSSSKVKYSSSGSSKKIGGLRVVNVVGFKRAYGFLNKILALAKPFGTVVQHLVLDVRPEAFLQLNSEEEAKAMVNFYSGNVTPTVCGKSVKIYHSQTYATIQSGRVVYVGQIPHFKSSDASLLKIAEPFGKVRRYFLNRSRNECFIEMERGEDAERMSETYKDTPPKFEGKRLTVYVNRKFKQLKYGHRPPAPDSEEKKRSSKRERSGSETSSHRSSAAKSSAKQDEEPPVKKSREEMVETPTEQSEVEVRKEEEVQGEHEHGQPSETSAVHKIDTDMNIKMEENETAISIVSVRSVEENGETASTPSQAEGKLSSTSPVPLGPYESNNPVGVEYVKMGYYCRVCFLFYSNEETAKKVHCSSQSHYQKLKKHLEKEKAKAQSTTGTKTPV
ncbi:matrin-3-like [Oncorhynchus nerka]|uniref:matrin-3-like n=1 Tax=Oncorhynchus nerka TaxID=8023 RepID=UPI0031B7ED76